MLRRLLLLLLTIGLALPALGPAMAMAAPSGVSTCHETGDPADEGSDDAQQSAARHDCLGCGVQYSFGTAFVAPARPVAPPDVAIGPRRLTSVLLTNDPPPPRG